MSDQSGNKPERRDPATLKQRRRRAVKTALIVGAIALLIYGYSLYQAFTAA